MKLTTIRRHDPLARTALWFYVAPRLVVLVVVSAVVLLAAFLILAQFARQWLAPFGA